ncbi:30S ribosomal protein S18 [Patescibacteria group bacterium]|nr:30S ribosomal protein S18 [Patescibacteria group bacterium]MBU1931674.1 30S ribosomal protein S18 [Patescibacteria group bacterium]
MKPKRRFRKRIEQAPDKCAFCEEKKEPDYKTVDSLVKHLSGRGKILSRKKSGLCAKHQRRLATAVKRARHLALLPFVGAV